MFDGRPILTGAGRYFQFHGALGIIGQEIKDYGRRALIVYADETVKQLVSGRIEKSLQETEVAFDAVVFPEACVAESFERIAQEAGLKKADMLLAVGGGRILDIVKGASQIAGLPVFTVPTSAATCAAFAVLYVEYDAGNGRIRGNHIMKQEISGVFADLDVILHECPTRYFVSGMVDAMAKQPEFTFTAQCLGSAGQVPALRSGVMMADYTYREYLSKGVQAVRDFEAKADTPLLDDFVSLNILMTGLISDLSVGGRMLALAHNFYDGICYRYHDIRARFLHGELVGMALPVQLYVNGEPEEKILELQEFLRQVHVPVKLSDIGFPDTEEAFEDMVDYLYTEVCQGMEGYREKIARGLAYLR